MSEQTRDFLSRSTLSADLLAGATSLTVADGSSFPSTGTFDIRIDDELIEVASRTGNTLSGLVRASGTPATTDVGHSAGSAVKEVITKRQLDALLTANASVTNNYSITNLSYHINVSDDAHLASQIEVIRPGGVFNNSTVDAALEYLGTLPGLGNINDSTILGNNIGAAGPAIALTAAQVKTLLQLTPGVNVVAMNDTRFSRLTSRTIPGTTDSPTATDAGLLLRCTNGSATTVTFDCSLFAVGDCGIIRQVGAGQVTVAVAGGQTILASDSKVKTAAQGAEIAWSIDSSTVLHSEGNRA